VSAASWVAEYYPIQARQVEFFYEATVHSILKWAGARPENLARHGVELHPAEPAALVELGSRDIVRFRFNGATCALCHVAVAAADRHGMWRDAKCGHCPLAEARGGTRCYLRTQEEEISPYDALIDEVRMARLNRKPSPEPMLAELRDTLNFLDEK